MSTITVAGKVLGRSKPLFTDWRVPLPPSIYEGGEVLTLRIPALNDEDLRMAAIAVRVLNASNIQETDSFERLEQVIHNFPSKTKSLEPLVWIG